MDDIHHYHHYENAPAPVKVNAKVEQNSRGLNYEVTVTGASTPEEAARLAKEAMQRLKAEFETHES